MERIRLARSVLTVTHEKTMLPDGSEPLSWIVRLADPREVCAAILWGFARKVDAEIAKRFLDSTGIDWSLPSEPMWRQCAENGFPTREKLMEAACEHLQW